MGEDGAARCFVHILNSVQFLRVTGDEPPQKPPTAREYTDAGLPWFDYYGGDLKALEGAKMLAGMDSVAAKRLGEGEEALPGNEAVNPVFVEKLTARPVRESHS